MPARPDVKQLIALLLCFVLLSPGIPAAASEAPANNRTVKAGVFFFDGYHMRDEDGNYTGYGIDLLDLISQYSHLNFEFVGYDNTWEEMQAMLLSGEIDVVTSAGKTRARTEIFGFSDPIDVNNTVLSVLEENTAIIPGDYSTYEGMIVGVLAGSSQNRTLPFFAAEAGFTYQTQEYEDSAALEAALRSREIDAILTSNLRRTEGEKVLDTTDINYFYAIVRKDDQELLNEINYAIDQMNLHEGDYWANDLYNKYYGSGDSSSAANLGFTRREKDYIDAVISGKKRITVMSLPGRRPYSYAEDGELKGIQPQFFDRLMRIAELPYEMIVPKDDAEYQRLLESGDIDVVIDHQQSASTGAERILNGFLTNSYMNTGTALMTREDHTGPIASLAVLEGLMGLPLEYEEFQNAVILPCSSQEDVVRAVLDGKTDAGFMRTHAAQYFINNDRTNSLRLDIIDSDQIAFSMYIPNSSDHELVNILNKCIRRVPDDVLNRLIVEYTASTPENVDLSKYMAAHPETIVSLAALAALAIGAILFFYLRFRWKNKLFRAMEQSKRDLEEQLAIANALSRDLSTVYKLDMRSGTVVALKMDQYMPSGMDWASGKAFPYTKALHRYIEEWIEDRDKDGLKEVLSLERLREELSARSEYTGNYRVRLDGEIHDFQFVCVAYRTDDQADPRVLIGFRNIDDIVRTEQKQKAALQDALHMAQAASEAKTAFLSSMSHDIRTPMNAIIGFLTLMRAEADRPDAVREYIQRIDAASQHLLGLINDVLDMNKIESGSTTLSLAEMDLAEIIAEISSIIRPQAKAKDQDFEIFVSHLRFEHLMGDKMRIDQILINLLSNAVKYTPENGTIEMRVEELPQVVDNYSRIRFTVSDDGLGMSEDYQKVIFEPFTREQDIIWNQIQGTGLGMAITKNLVELMGGTIKLDSKLGEGSTFTVELDLRVQEKEADPKFWDEHGILRIFVADGDEDICRDIVKKMDGTGVEVRYATNGTQAVEMIRAARKAGDPYDLILLDWKMPDLNGLEVAQLIRKKYLEKVPILLFSAYDWSDIKDEALDLGIDHFLPKPFFMSSFKDTVRRINRKRSPPLTDRGEDIVVGKHILVVDDIEINRIVLTKILTMLGASCEIAVDGQEVVDKFLASQPGEYDMIFMDIQMPRLDGYEATRTICASSHPAAKEVAIIAMTANAFVDDIRKALDSGMDAHISKPIVLEQLKSTVLDVLQRKRARS